MDVVERLIGFHCRFLYVDAVKQSVSFAVSASVPSCKARNIGSLCDVEWCRLSYPDLLRHLRHLWTSAPFKAILGF